MRTRLALADVPFQGCNYTGDLKQMEVPNGTTVCYTSSENLYFTIWQGLEIHVSIWNPSKETYDEPVSLENGLNAVSCSTLLHPAHYKFVNTLNSKNLRIDFERFLTSSDNYKMYYGSRNRVSKF